jgi:hypothetical protein
LASTRRLEIAAQKDTLVCARVGCANRRQTDGSQFR